MKPETPNPNADLLRRTMTPAERAAGRFLRAPDGHEGGDGGDGGETALGSAEQKQAEGDEGQQGQDQQAGGEGQDQGKKGEEGKEGDQGQQAKAPEKYELVAPDGFEQLDTEIVAEAEPILRELDLTNDQANKLMPLAGQLVKKTIERAEKAITDRAIAQRKEWADALEADADVGGAKKAEALSAAARVFDHYGLKKGEGLRQLLDESGLGNNPEMVRLFARIGNDMAEGSFERGSTVTTPKTAEQALYGPEFQPK